MDEIVIESLTIKASIGVNQWEHKIKQLLVVDIYLYCDFTDINDDINKTIDYDELSRNVESYCEQCKFKLIETVANNIALELLNQYPIQKAKVSISKPHALRQAKNVKAVAIRSK